MGLDHDEQGPSMPGVNDAHSEGLERFRAPEPSRVRRVILSVLAGGGLTAVGLTGPLAGGAIAANPPTGLAPPSGTTTTPASAAPTQTAPTATTPTTTTSTPTTTSTTPPGSVPTGTTQTQTQTPIPTSTTQTPQSPASAQKPAPKVVVQHTQETTKAQALAPAPSSVTPDQTKTPAPTVPGGSTNIAAAPQLAAAQSQALAAMLAGSAASIRALDFYRIPLFLLPIYQAAAVQYGVPWPVLAAINEVETDFGTDLSVSTAGAVGWMQFMPETWLQYGVDAVNAGYADPYNPVDAIFAAARYLHAAGAATDLRAAILAYNHSEAYVESVLLRARLFASYPPSVIATLTGLTEGSLPVAGAKLSPSSIIPQGAVAPAPVAAAPGETSSATAGASATKSKIASATPGAGAALPGTTVAPSPEASAAIAERAADAAAPPSQLSSLLARKGAPVVAVEDGRIVGLGRSRKLGRYVVLRDTYGDLFTYAGLGSIAPEYRLPKAAQVRVPSGALSSGESANDPTPKQSATGGRQLPVTLHVAKKKGNAASVPAEQVGSSAQAQPPLTTGKVRVFAHPNNPDAVAATRLRSERGANVKALADGWLKLRRGAVVAQGTVIGHLDASGESPESSLRFAIRPAGAQSAIDPKPILENWRQLNVALHPKGAKDGPVLAGATASDAFLLSRAELGSAVLADPDIKLGQCDRAQVSAGKVSPQALALLVFLSRSGLKPTVGQLRCGDRKRTATGASVTTFPRPDTLELTAINGIPVAGHQGAGTITDITIRTLLTLQHQFAPKRIVSLMRYPGAPSTIAASDYADYIKIELSSKHAASKTSKVSRAKSARVASASSTAPLVVNPVLDTLEWQRLMTQLSGLQAPKLTSKPSTSAILDKQAAPGNRGLGTRALP